MTSSSSMIRTFVMRSSSTASELPVPSTCYRMVTKWCPRLAPRAFFAVQQSALRRLFC